MGFYTGRGFLLTAALLIGSATGSGAQTNISFQPPIKYEGPVAAPLYGVSGTPFVTADFDGDGRLDLCVITQDGVSVLYGNGDGTFAPPVDYALGKYVQEGVAADVNGDGRPDLVLCQYGLGKLLVLLNQGGRKFALPINIPVGDQPVGVTAADFNGDGAVDLAVSCAGSRNLTVLLNRGDGTFLPPVAYGGIDSPGGIISGDFNGDGKIDLAQTSLTENVVRVLLGDGTGKFTEIGRFPTNTSYANRVLTADFNGDGILDLVVPSLGQYSILFGDGTGRFGPAVTYTGYQSMDVGDFDGDGQPDLVAPGADFSGISIFLNHDAGNFLNAVTFPGPGTKTLGVRVGDFNGDGRPDVVAWDESSPHLLIYLNNTPRPTPAIRSLALTPSTVGGGCDTMTGTLTLTAPAPAGGILVSLSSSNPAVQPPASVRVTAGEASATFPLAAGAVTSTQPGSLLASYQGSGKRATFLVRPGGALSLRLNPSSVVGGQPVTGQVTLPCPAGPGGVAVPLGTNHPELVQIPQDLVVSAGMASASFPVTTRPVNALTAAAITAQINGQPLSAALELRPVPPPPPPPPPINLLVNGSFEDPDTSTSTIGWLIYGPAGIPGQPPAGTSIPGWKITGGTVKVVSWYWKAAVGSQSLDLVGDNPGTIEQSFATDVGRDYIFSGVIAHNPANVYFAEGRANVFVDRAFLTQLLHQDPTVTVSEMHWTPFSVRFRATAPMTTLTISDATGSPFPGGLVLDGLAVSPAN
jgi:hypothetical protein